MSDPYIRNSSPSASAARIRQVLPSISLKDQARQESCQSTADVDLIDMGVGEPDEMADVVKTLQEEAAKPENRGYADNGGDEFKQAAVNTW